MESSWFLIFRLNPWRLHENLVGRRWGADLFFENYWTGLNPASAAALRTHSGPGAPLRPPEITLARAGGSLSGIRAERRGDEQEDCAGRAGGG